jgi:hypothetical protein
MDHLKKPVVVKGFKDENYPYFFRNDEIAGGKQTYIVQKASSVGQALAICDRWKREKFNITDATNELLYYVPYIKYMYNSNNDIEMIKVIPDDEDSEDDDDRDRKDPKDSEYNKHDKHDKSYYHDREYEILMYLKDGRVNIVALLPYSHKENEDF